MGRQVLRGHQGPNGRQVPSLTSCGMHRLDGRHISMGRQVLRRRWGPSGHQVSTLTSLDMLCLDDHYVSRGRQVPYSSPKTCIH